MTDDKTTTEEERRALVALEAAARPAAYGQIGGFRPDPSDRLASWWGGNFAGLPGVAAPINRATGAPLSPLVQIRVDTAPVQPPCLEDTALLSFWIDLTAFTSDNPQQGVHFDVLRSPTLDNLGPLGPGYRERHALPCLPIRWRESGLEAPHWSDYPKPIPPDFDHEMRKSAAERREGRPLELGGWPDWIQHSTWPRGVHFVLQIDSTEKGRLLLGDEGSIYLFRHGETWIARGDCF